MLGLALCSCLLGWRHGTKCDEAREAAGELRRLVRLYRQTHGKLPASIDELITAGELDSAVDPWGRPYRYEVSGERVRVWSEGRSAMIEADNIDENSHCSERQLQCSLGQL